MRKISGPVLRWCYVLQNQPVQSRASVPDRIPEPYHASLDGNEQYDKPRPRFVHSNVTTVLFRTNSKLVH